MRDLLARHMKMMTRLATGLATVVAGVSLVLISSAAAAPVDIKNPVLVQKVVKAEASDSKPFFNNRPFFDNRPFFVDNRPFFDNRPFINRPFINRPFFNPFFRPNFFNPFFDVDAEAFD